MNRLTLLILVAVLIANGVDSKTYRIGSLLALPFLDVNVADKYKYEGFVPEFIEELFKYLNLKYEIVVPSHADPGHFDEETKQWTGLIGDIIDGKIDLALGILTVTDKKKTVVDYSTPYLHNGYGVLYAPGTEKIPFYNLDELVNQTTVKYGTKIGGAAYFNINALSNTEQTYKRLIQFWDSNPQYLMATDVEGIERVVKEESKYAFITEVHAADYVKQFYPTVVQVGHSFFTRDFAIAMQKGMFAPIIDSPLLQKINTGIAHLAENGLLTILKKKWKLTDN